MSTEKEIREQTVVVSEAMAKLHEMHLEYLREIDQVKEQLEMGLT